MRIALPWCRRSRLELHNSFGDDLLALPMELDHFGARVVLRRDEKQITGAPERRRDRDRVIRLEGHPPLQITVYRIDADRAHRPSG